MINLCKPTRDEMLSPMTNMNLVLYYHFVRKKYHKTVSVVITVIKNIYIYSREHF